MTTKKELFNDIKIYTDILYRLNLKQVAGDISYLCTWFNSDKWNNPIDKQYNIDIPYKNFGETYLQPHPRYLDTVDKYSHNCPIPYNIEHEVIVKCTDKEKAVRVLKLLIGVLSQLETLFSDDEIEVINIYKNYIYEVISVLSGEEQPIPPEPEPELAKVIQILPRSGSNNITTGGYNTTYDCYDLDDNKINYDNVIQDGIAFFVINNTYSKINTVSVLKTEYKDYLVNENGILRINSKSYYQDDKIMQIHICDNKSATKEWFVSPTTHTFCPAFYLENKYYILSRLGVNGWKTLDELHNLGYYTVEESKTLGIYYLTNKGCFITEGINLRSGIGIYYTDGSNVIDDLVSEYNEYSYIESYNLSGDKTTLEEVLLYYVNNNLVVRTASSYTTLVSSLKLDKVIQPIKDNVYIYITSNNDIIEGYTYENGYIGYNNIKETIDDFYNHGDRLMTTEIEDTDREYINSDGNLGKLFIDKNYIINTD